MPNDGLAKSLLLPLILLSSSLVSLWHAIIFLFVDVIWANLTGSSVAKFKMAGRPASGRPVRNQDPVVDGRDDTPREIASLHAHQKQAYGYIAKALEIDEGEGETALILSAHFQQSLPILDFDKVLTLNCEGMGVVLT